MPSDNDLIDCLCDLICEVCCVLCLCSLCGCNDKKNSPQAAPTPGYNQQPYQVPPGPNQNPQYAPVFNQTAMPGYQTDPYAPVNPMQPYSGAAPYSPGATPYPPGAAHYPPGAAPYPPGAAPYPPGSAAPYPPATGAPYPPAVAAPYSPAGPYSAGAAAPLPSYSESVAQNTVPPNAPIINEQYGKQSPFNPNY